MQYKFGHVLITENYIEKPGFFHAALILYCNSITSKDDKQTFRIELHSKQTDLENFKNITHYEVKKLLQSFIKKLAILADKTE